MSHKDVVAALKEKFNGMDLVEKVLVSAVLIMVFLAAASLLQGSVEGGSAVAGGRASSGGGLNMIFRGPGR